MISFDTPLVALADPPKSMGNTGKKPITVQVNTRPRPYSIHVGAGLISRVAEFVPDNGGKSGLLVAGETVMTLFGDDCLKGLREKDWQIVSATVPDGEGAKTLKQAEHLYEVMLSAKLDRGATVFALGGGVVSDLAGFVAATYMRGVRFVPIPTTLLAQVDASVGGKTAVDLPAGKNLVGAIHQPETVVISVETLAQLPDRELRSGMAEVVKHAAIADQAMFDYIEGIGGKLLEYSEDIYSSLVARNCQIKAAVVAADPEERGLRACLNYGHTVGHAVEAGACDWQLRHGEAIALGMVVESRVAAKLGYCEPQTAERQERVLAALGLPTGGLSIDFSRAVAALRHDKKIQAGTLKLPLVPAVGSVEIRTDVPLEVIEQALAGVCLAE